MSKVTCDAEGLSLRILQLGERVTRGVAAVMVEEGEKIHRLAVSNCPVDKGNLKDAIKLDVDRKGTHGRTRVSVYIDENAEGTDGVSIGHYASMMEHGLAPYGTGFYGDVFNPKYPYTKSKAKAAAGHDVGGKFLERAVSERRDILLYLVKDLVRRETNRK